jgi:hypothetical protein
MRTGMAWDNNYINLDEYIALLLKDGKRYMHPEFQQLVQLYGKEKIVEKAHRILAENIAREREGKPHE